MKFKFSVEGDTYEDWDEAKIFIHSHDLYSAVVEATDYIRNELKYQENNIESIRHLEELREILWIETLMV